MSWFKQLWQNSREKGQYLRATSAKILSNARADPVRAKL